MNILSALRLLGAFALGTLLYQVAVIEVGGTLAALAIPKVYFQWFGRANYELALAVLQLVSFALPVAVLVAGGVLATHRMLAGGTKATLAALFAGLAGSAIYVLAAIATANPTAPGAESSSSFATLHQLLLPAWWAVSGTLAPWAGFAFAAWMLTRKRRTPQA